MKNLLIIFFISFPFVSFAENIEFQIKNLKTIRLQKMKELSELATTITEKNKLLHTIVRLADDQISSKKGCQNENMNTENISASLDHFDNKFNAATKDHKNIKGFLVKELIKEQKKGVNNFESLKFAVVRFTHEYDFLKALVEKYEETQQELIDIDQKLEDLNK